MFEMDGSSTVVPSNKKKGDGDDGQKGARTPAAEELGLVQANPWPFYLDLPVGPKGDGPKGNTEENSEGKIKREEQDQPAAAPWPYHGPSGGDDGVSATIHPSATSPSGGASGTDTKQETVGTEGGDDVDEISALDDYLSSLGIEDEVEEVSLGRADSTLKPRPLSLSGRGRAASEGAVQKEGEAAPPGRTYTAYRPSGASSAQPAYGQQPGEGPQPGSQGSQQPEYPAGTAPHHFYMPQGLMPPRKPVPSTSPTSPTFPSPRLPSPQQQHQQQQKPASPNQDSVSPGYPGYVPPSRTASGPTSPVQSSTPGFVAYHPNAGPISPRLAQNTNFTAFRPDAGSSSQASSPVVAAFSHPGRVTSPHQQSFRPSPPQETATKFQGPPYPDEKSGYATSPGAQHSQQFERYASPPAVSPNRLASPPVGGARPHNVSRHDSPAQPSPVSSPGSAGFQDSHQRISPHLSSPQLHPPPPPPPPPQEPLTSASSNSSPAAFNAQHAAQGSEEALSNMGTRPLSPQMPDGPPPPYMPVDLPPRPGSAGVPPSYRMNSSPEPQRAGSYGPLRPSVTGEAPHRPDHQHYHHHQQARPDGQSHPSAPQQQPAGYMRPGEEAAPPPLPPRRASSPPLPPVPPPPPPRPTNASGAGRGDGRGPAAAPPMGFGRGLPNATSFPPPPKANTGSGVPRPPRMPVGRPPPAPSSQRPPPAHGNPSSQRPSTSHTSGWRPPNPLSSTSQGPGGHGSSSQHYGGGRGGGENMFWSASAKKWLHKTERLVEQTLGDIMQPQVDQGAKPGQMPGGYPSRGRGR